MPAQRIPRYRLLFETLIKQYPDTEENKTVREKVQKVLSKVSELAEKCNKFAGNFEEFSDMTEIYERLGNDPRLKRKAIRQFYKMDSFIKVNHHATQETIILILFNDLLLLATNAPDKENPNKLLYQNSFDLSIYIIY